MNYKLLTINYKLVFLLIYTSTTFIYPLFEEKEIFANSSGLCSAFTANEESPVAVYYNPAGLFNTPKHSFYFSNTNLYNLSQLSNNTLCFSSEIKSLGKVGLMYNIFGFELYKENFLSIAYSNCVGEKISFGFSIKSLSVDIKNYGGRSFLSYDFGILAKPYNNFLCSVVVKDLIPPKIAEDEVVNRKLIVGSKLKLLKGAFSYFDFIKDSTEPIFARVGEEIKLNLNEYFTGILRFGVETATEFKPAKYSFGFGVVYNLQKFDFLFDYAYIKHSVLGEQHIFSLGINIGKKEEILEEVKISSYKRKKTAEVKEKEVGEKKVVKEKLPTKPININKATFEEIAVLPGIGPSTAQKIVEYREQIGGFTSLEQLLEVPRVGSLTLQRIKPYVILSDEEEKQKVITEPQKGKEELKTEEVKKESTVEVAPSKPITEEKKYNLNKITQDELKTLGFSSLEIKNILRYRERFGKFNSVEELYKIPNINKNTVDKVKNLLYVE